MMINAAEPRDGSIYWGNVRDDSEDEEDTFISGSGKRYEQLEVLPEEIEVISTSMPLMRIISFISSIIFLVMLMICFMFNCPQLSFIFISLPLSITIIGLIMYLNSSIMLQSLISNGKQLRLHLLLHYSCLNCGGISLLIFVCLLSLRLDRLIMSDYVTIIRPLLLTGAIYLVYSLVIMPMINDKINWAKTALTSIDALCAMLAVRFMLDDSVSYSIAFAPCALALGAHLGVLWRSDERSTERLMKIAGISLIAISLGVLCLKLERVIANDSHVVEIGVLLVGYLMICSEFLCGTFKEDISVIKKAANTKFV